MFMYNNFILVSTFP